MRSVISRSVTSNVDSGFAKTMSIFPATKNTCDWLRISKRNQTPKVRRTSLRRSIVGNEDWPPEKSLGYRDRTSTRVASSCALSLNLPRQTTCLPTITSSMEPGLFWIVKFVSAL